MNTDMYESLAARRPRATWESESSGGDNSDADLTHQRHYQQPAPSAPDLERPVNSCMLQDHIWGSGNGPTQPGAPSEPCAVETTPRTTSDDIEAGYDADQQLDGPEGASSSGVTSTRKPLQTHLNLRPAPLLSSRISRCPRFGSVDAALAEPSITIELYSEVASPTYIASPQSPDTGQHRAHLHAAAPYEPVLAVPVSSLAMATGLPQTGRDLQPKYVPDHVRRVLYVEVGKRATRGAKTWEDLANSMGEGALAQPRCWLTWTSLFTLLSLGLYLFMAGQYGQYAMLRAAVKQTQQGTGAGPTTLGESPSSTSATTTSINESVLAALQSLAQQDSTAMGPASLGSWLVFWTRRSAYAFHFRYLIEWGGRYGPSMAQGQGWRVLTCIFIHQNAVHLAGNLALFWVLSLYLEAQFGMLRVLPIWLLSGVAGSLASTAFESPCSVTVGASGAVFGLVGAYLADAALNTDISSRLIMLTRLLGVAACIALLVVVQLVGGAGGSSVSYASHLGGFITGLLAAGVLLPDTKAQRCNKVFGLLHAADMASHMPAADTCPGPSLYSWWQRYPRARQLVYVLAAAYAGLVFVGAPAYAWSSGRLTGGEDACGGPLTQPFSAFG